MRFRIVKLAQELIKNGNSTCVAVFDEARFRWVPLKPLAENFDVALLQNDEKLQYDLLHTLCEYDQIKESLGKILELSSEFDFSDSFEEEINEIPFDIHSLRRRSVFEDFEIQRRRKFFKKKKKLRHFLYSKIESITNRIPGQFIPDEQFYFSPNFSYENHLNLYPSSCVLDIPECISNLDIEGSVGVVIGNTKKIGDPIRNVSPEEAKDCIVGFSVLSHLVSRNINVRDVEKASAEVFATAISSEVSTPDEVYPFFQMVKNELRVNDELINEGSSLYSVFQPEEVVSFASEGTNLYTGEVISLGCFPNCSGFVNDIEYNIENKIEFNVRAIGTVECTIGEREGLSHWKRRKPMMHYFRYYRNQILIALLVCLLIIFRKHTWMRFLKKKKISGTK